MHLASFRPRVAYAALLASLSLLVAATLTVPGVASGPSPLADARDDPTNCTVAFAADDSGAFAGNNEDEINPLTNIWFVPGEGDSYGSAFVGYHDLVIQGGMNEAGLFFDGLGVREVDVPAQPGKPTYTGENLFVDLLAECDSVACVLERYGALNAPGTWNGQVLFGDRYGDSAIIEPLTVIPKSGDYQVATNFFQSEVPPAERTDQRYVTATSMLADAESFSVDLMREVMDATHQEGTVNTVYSTVYDLQAAVIHLYYFNDFTTEVTFDLADELGQGVHGYAVSDLFPANQAATDVAAPIRNQLAAAVAQLGPVTVAGDDVADLAGTYEAEAMTFMFQATDDGLAVRQAWTPWVDLVPLSPTEFARVTVDGAGVLHGQRVKFSVGTEPATVEISQDQAGSIVATRTDVPAGPVGWRPIAIIVALGGAAVISWWLTRARRPRRTESPGLTAPLATAERHR
jgi:hypothetical protein